MSSRVIGLSVEANSSQDKKGTDKNDILCNVSYYLRDVNEDEKIRFKDTQVRDVLYYNTAFGFFYDKNKSYHRIAIESLANLFHDFAYEAEKSATVPTFMKDYSQQLTKDGVPLEMVNMFRALSDVLQYTVNCTSWRSSTPESGEFHSFDKMEIQNRLMNIANSLRW